MCLLTRDELVSGIDLSSNILSYTGAEQLATSNGSVILSAQALPMTHH